MAENDKPKKKAATKKKAPAKMGRPTNYTPEIADKICEGIAKGNSLVRVCAPQKMPQPRTVYYWIRKFPDFARNYENAKEDQADFMVEEMMEIGNSADSDNVQVARLQIDTRKWVASKFKQKRYGDKLQTDNTNHNLDYADLSDDELDAAIARLES